MKTLIDINIFVWKMNLLYNLIFQNLPFKFCICRESQKETEGLNPLVHFPESRIGLGFG